ncbi:unnamed protein product [Coffea canephora]|uniref:myrcene synthase n=1 Tax=Coffea canephora TaxID=49390 RepID=A0A068V5T1_COFCA|nr:unnamed protein product [Coffea canephora]
MAQFTTLFSERQPTFHYSLGHGLTFKTSAILSTSSSCSISPPVKTLLVTSKLGEQQLLRRSGNYQPSTWDFCYVESLSNQYSGKRYINRCLVLKEQVKMMLDEEVDLLIQLKLIDDLQRLGIAYHFQNKIQSILSGVYKENHLGNTSREKDLYATALEFRLLRQHGFDVSQEVFNCFKNEKGNFKANLCEDIKGMLHLYEASFLLVESESTLEMAREFSSECLENVLNHEGISEELILLVQHSLELPLHWRMQRLEARWFIDMYEKRANRNPTLLDLAKIDFNLVQATHQDDLQYASRWWQSTCLAENLAFARDRLVENFFWTVGVIFDPQQGYCRRMSTRVNALVTTIDDVYDVYGTLDELELFTAAVERWDLGVMDQLPSYLKLCYFALYNSINEMAYDVMKEQGVHVISYLKNSWTDLCKAYLQEAKWYHSGYVPTLQEYLDNAWISISAPVILVHAYFFVSSPITNEALECLDRYHNIIRCSAMILRLADDLGTSTDELQRGDVPKSIQCYMNESGASEEEAREHTRFLIGEAWKQMNKERVADSPFSQTFIGMAMNLGRMAQCMYQYGDGHGSSNSQTKDRIRALLLDPVGLSF